MTKAGIRKLQCTVCGQIREVETGIRTMYCCAKPMVEVVEEEAQEQESALKLKPRQ